MFKPFKSDEIIIYFGVPVLGEHKCWVNTNEFGWAWRMYLKVEDPNISRTTGGVIRSEFFRGVEPMEGETSRIGQAVPFTAPRICAASRASRSVRNRFRGNRFS